MSLKKTNFAKKHSIQMGDNINEVAQKLSTLCGD